jgi:hypothetical protein
MRKITTLACLGFLTAAPLLAQSSPSPLVEDRLLREELALAKSPSLYFILYLKSRTMSLRAGGLTLKDWKVARVHAWGAAPLLEALTVEKKSTLHPPKRIEIIPTADDQTAATQPDQKKAEPEKTAKKEDEQKNASFELDALELKDMPPVFTIFLSDGTRVSIRPKAHKLFPRIASFGHSLSWYLWVPLKNLWYHLKKKPFTAIDITLETKEDVQSIYWSLADGAKGLVFPL